VPLQTLVRLKEEDGGVFGPEDIAVMATFADRAPDPGTLVPKTCYTEALCKLA
jgi:hypothetical protein